MKSKLVLQHRAIVFTCCTAFTLLLINNEAQAQLDQRKPRPDPADAVLKVQQLPPALEKILKDWENNSKKIEKLEGSHTRYWYDDVFQVEKLSKGKFYYEHPDKGRIDITGAEVPKGAQGKKRNKQGKPYQLKPGENERWICDGKRIFSINEDEKSYEVYPIPLNARGANIMEGPLPFLFGMPAETAKKRYFLKLMENSPQRIIIAVKPRRRADAENYSEAKVMLNPQTFLPSAVQLIHPGGNQTTVYTFEKVVANKKGGIFNSIFGRNPFIPDLDDYQLQGKVAAVAEGPKAPNPVQQVTFKVPSMIGRDYKAAQQMLVKMGFVPEIHRGAAAPEPKVIYHVYQQLPKPGTAAKKGETVHLRLYDNPKTAQK